MNPHTEQKIPLMAMLTQLPDLPEAARSVPVPPIGPAGTDRAAPFAIQALLARLAEEHADLRCQLLELYGTAKIVGFQEDVINWVGTLRDLRKHALRFMEKLDGHAEWEELALFPAVEQAVGGGNRGILIAIEAKHAQARLYVDAFASAVDAAVSPIRREEAKAMAAYLLLACEALTAHFDGEERYLVGLKPDPLHWNT